MTANRVLINSLPKSGTHLLAKAIELCGFEEHFDPENMADPQRVTPLFLNYREVKQAMAQQPAQRQQAANIPVGTLTPTYADPQTFAEWLAAMPTGRYLLGHMGYTADLPPLLADYQVRHVFIIRDPRAVLASLLSFILDTKGMPKPHFLEADFRQLNAQQRLDLLLEGGYAPQAGVQVAAFRDIFHKMLAWQQDPQCLVVKFEDLVGEQGGGTQARQAACFERIATHVGRALDTELMGRFSQIYSTKSRTFRQGSIAGWQQSLDAASVERVRVYCQPLCDLAAYE